MTYKQPYKVRRPLVEVSDAELEAVWWWAFTRNDFSSSHQIDCNVNAFRTALVKLLNENGT